MRALYFNGKFYSGGMNGVHRVSDRLIREVDAILAEMPVADRPAATLLLPQGCQWQPALRAISIEEQAGGGTQRWEQFRLPTRARDGVLVNLANLSPIRHKRKVTMLHDAQFLFPDSGYPLRQRVGYRLLTPRMARSSEIVLTVSEYSRQMLDLLGVSVRDRTQVLYNGAYHILEVESEPTALDTLGLVSGGYALMFGSPKAYKNNRVVFDAFSAGGLASIKLVVIGASREALTSAGLIPPPDTVFAGKCNDSVLRALYEHAHCLLFPSRTEGFGLPPVEAMLCGCPTIVAPGGAIPEICRDAALYADVDDPASWRSAIELLHDPEARAAKIGQGSVRGRDFTWTAAGRRLFEIVTGLARA